MRAIPNLVVICPGDAFEVRAAMRAVLEQEHPAYIRLGKKGEATVHAEVPSDFRIGRAITIRKGHDVCLLSTGNMLPEAVHAAEELAGKGISATVVSFHTVKPLDEACLQEAFANYKIVATLEEHSLIGGFGSAVSEWLVDRRMPATSLLRFGTPDRFYKLSGEQEFAREQLDITGHQIAERVAAALA